MGEPCLDLAGLVLTRAGRAGSPAFRLEIPRLTLWPGARIGLVGESGIGKSTLLDLLALIRRPDQAKSFRLLGTEIAPDLLKDRARRLTRYRRRHISYILQDGGLLPYLSVGANARLATRLARAGHGAQIETLAEGLGIAPLLHKLPSALSGGQRQRAAVLRGLVSQAELILADEPTAALDATNAGATMRLIADLPEDRAVLVSSHHEALLSACGFALWRLVARERSAALTRVSLEIEAI
ncbi:ATP-binding cassette domain-containing protein [Paracoccus aminophilus]|uniref:ABC transporter, ATP-binding protein n=1 Tax=Paracoccus aminophilus JCM 7686 TaxID=1367847 RepID=S5YRQ1_PARAH|nr:ATP-binding cassette domain-containing protein [Paracoccus aminophilus]AGT07931.1 ABC transporter, ATP-binding protein [Paracoccus aminophilus JCM 7686]